MDREPALAVADAAVVAPCLREGAAPDEDGPGWSASAATEETMASRVGAVDLLVTPPRVVQASRHPFAGDEAVGAHRDRSVTIAVVEQGRGVLHCGRVRFALQPGCVCYAPSASPVGWNASGRGLVVTTVHLAFVPWQAPIQPRSPQAELAQPDDAPIAADVVQPWAHAFRVRDAGDLRVLAQRIIDAWADPRGRGEALLRALATELIALLGAAARAEDRPHHPLASTILGIASWMEVNLARRIARADLVAKTGLDATTLTAAFNAIVGRSPIDYLIDLRVRRAKALLRTTNLTVREIGRQVGIPDPFYFSKLFARRTGLPPKRHRCQRTV